MKKSIALASAILVSCGLAFPTSAALADCDNYAVWTFDGDDGTVKRWSTTGELISTVSSTINAGDIALSTDLSKFIASDRGDSELKFYNSSTGAEVSSHALTGSLTGAGGAGAGVIANGTLLLDDSNIIHSVNLNTWVSTQWADLDDADSDLPIGDQGTPWEVAGDILQLPDNDILILGIRDADYYNVYVLRVNPLNTTDIDIVGTIDATSIGQIWGAARAGDDVFIATEFGSLLKLGSIPTAVSTAAISTTSIVTGGGSFWGAAGSNDSTEGSATCNGTPSVTVSSEGLAPTGSNDNVGIATGLIALATAVAAVVLRRRRKA